MGVERNAFRKDLLHPVEVRHFGFPHQPPCPVEVVAIAVVGVREDFDLGADCLARRPQNLDITLKSRLARHPFPPATDFELQACVTALDSFLSFFQDGTHAPVFEPDVAEVKRAVIGLDPIARSVAEQFPGRLLAELANQIEQRPVEVHVPGEQVCKGGRASHDATVLESINIQRIDPDQLLEPFQVIRTRLRITHHAHAFYALIGRNADERVGVSMPFRSLVVGIHRHELVEAALNGNEGDPADAAPRAGRRSQGCGSS